MIYLVDSDKNSFKSSLGAFKSKINFLEIFQASIHCPGTNTVFLDSLVISLNPLRSIISSSSTT